MKILLILVALFTVVDAQAACNNKSLTGQYAYDYNVLVNGVNYYNYGTMTFDGKANIGFPASPVSPGSSGGMGSIAYSGYEGGIQATATGVYIFNANCELSISLSMTPQGYTPHNEISWSRYGIMSGSTVISGGGNMVIVFNKGDKLYPAGGSFNGQFSLRKK
jgi:hypothetical protein